MPWHAGRPNHRSQGANKPARRDKTERRRRPFIRIQRESFTKVTAFDRAYLSSGTKRFAVRHHYKKLSAILCTYLKQLYGHLIGLETITTPASDYHLALRCRYIGLGSVLVCYNESSTDRPNEQ